MTLTPNARRCFDADRRCELRFVKALHIADGSFERAELHDVECMLGLVELFRCDFQTSHLNMIETACEFEQGIIAMRTYSVDDRSALVDASSCAPS